ncbi:MAG: phage integrase SAM-like domain-containing protein [Saccharofermentans sp.]|nr:phage integrase SAM-like domain-containing protein [Saccharofermentans sp.]
MLKTLLTRKKWLTFTQYSDTFLEQISRTRSRNTILSYRQVLRRAADRWDGLLICEITKSMVKSYMSELQDIYKYSTVCLHFDMLRNVFRAAAEDDIICNSPMQGMKKPMRRKDDA